MKDSIKNVVCFATIIIVLMACSAMSLKLIIDEPLCGFVRSEWQVDLTAWLIVYLNLCLAIIIGSLMIQSVISGRFLSKIISLICDHMKELSNREVDIRKTAMDNIAGIPIDRDAIAERYAQWDKDDEEYEKQYNEYQEEYKYFSYLLDDGSED